MKVKPKKYIVWSVDRLLDLSNPWIKKWFIKQVLTKGRAEDVAQLDWEEVKRLLPELDLPENIKSLWEDYFDSQR
jgi:hypothetical protein